MLHRSLGLLMIVTTTARGRVPGTALAAPPGAKGDAVTDKARELHKEGDALYEKGDFARARAAYLGAWLLKKHWQIALNLGDVEVRLGLYRDAAEHLAFYLRESAKEEPPPPEARKLYDQARASVGTLEITSSAAGAEIAVDGKVVGVTPLADPVFVEPGEHTVEVRQAADFVTKVLTVKRGETGSFVMNPGAKAAELEPRPPDCQRQEEPPRRSLIPVYAGAGATAVALGTGVVLMLLSNGASGDVDVQMGSILQDGGQCIEPPSGFAKRCAELHETGRGPATLGDGARVAYLASGALAVATVVVALWPRPPAAAARQVRVLPELHATGAGLAFVGAW